MKRMKPFIFLRHKRAKKLFSLCLAGALAIGAITLFVYGIWASTFDLKHIGEIPDRSVIYDTNDKLYSRLYGQDRIVVSRGEIPKTFVWALLAREDTRF